MPRPLYSRPQSRLPAKLQRWGVAVSMGADTKANSRAAAYLRVVIIVSLRMAASAEAPSAPMLLFPILRGMGSGSTVRGQVRVSGR